MRRLGSGIGSACAARSAARLGRVQRPTLLVADKQVVVDSTNVRPQDDMVKPGTNVGHEYAIWGGAEAETFFGFASDCLEKTLTQMYAESVLTESNSAGAVQ